MRFNIKALNPGTIFYFDESKGEEGGSITLRVCAGDDIKSIHRQTSKRKTVFKDGIRYEYDEITPAQEDLRNALLWDFCIVDWKNIYDEEGNLIPCTKENKSLLMGKSVEFANFVSEKIKLLGNLEEQQKEEQEKN